MSDLSVAERREAAEWLAKMLDQPETHRDDLEAWLSGSEARRAHYNRLLAGLVSATAGAEMAGMRARKIERPRPWRIFESGKQWRPTLVASALTIVMGAVGYQFTRNEGMIADSSPMTIKTRIGEVRPARLADGTVATLDTGTEIVVDFRHDARKVLLKRGRVRFAVADRGTPFRVVEGANSVETASGTFDVSYRGTLTAQVVDGAAEVRLRPAAYFAYSDAPVLLTPGRKLVFASGQKYPPSAIDARPSDEQWIGGVKSLNDVPIKEVIAEANSYSETKIVLANPDIGDKTIFGDLHIRDVEAVAKAIAGYLHLEIDRSRPGRLILTAPN